MFIYHFTKLIKSKLIWGFLIFLIAFAFVFADACSSRGGEAMTYYVGDEAVEQDIVDNARYYFNLVDGDRGYFIPLAPLFWDLDARALSDEEAAARPDIDRSERFWKFIAAVKKLNKDMGIPDKIEGIRKEDIPVMAEYAEKEANPLYPVPKLMTRKELESFYYKVADWSK